MSPGDGLTEAERAMAAATEAYQLLAPLERAGRFLADIPDGALIWTDPETAGVLASAIEAAGRRMTVKGWPFWQAGEITAKWDGPADGEHHEVQAWL